MVLGKLSIVSIFVAFVAGCAGSTVNTAKKKDSSFWYCQPAGEESWSCDDNLDSRQANSEQSKVTPSPFVQTDQIVDSQDTVSEVHIAKDDVDNHQTVILPEQKSLTVATDHSPSDSAFPEAELTSESESVEQMADQSLKESSETLSLNNQAVDTDRADTPSFFYQKAWLIQVAAYRNKEAANELSSQVENSHVIETFVNGKQYFNVIVSGFDSHYEAEVAAEPIARQLDIQPWIRTSRSLRAAILE